VDTRISPSGLSLPTGLAFDSKSGDKMHLDPNRSLSKQALFGSFVAGLGLSLLTQLAVLAQHGPKIYVSLLWAPLFPVQYIIREICQRFAVLLHAALSDSIATGIAIVISSALFGIIAAGLAAFASSKRGVARYFGIIIIVIIILSAVFWRPMSGFI
jgi:hypothetical protein